MIDQIPQGIREIDLTEDQKRTVKEAWRKGLVSYYRGENGKIRIWKIEHAR